MKQKEPMRPPLELTVHAGTNHNHRAGWVMVSCPGCTADSAMRAKRLKDAELSAELFRAVAWLGAKGRAFATEEGRNVVLAAAFTFGPITRDEYEFEVLQRLLNRPDHDSPEAN